MQTNFINDRCLLLQDEENQPIAVISCKAGLQDIDSKLTQAISEHLDSGIVNITDASIITDANHSTDFKVTIYEEEEITEKFTLSFIAVY